MSFLKPSKLEKYVNAKQAALPNKVYYNLSFKENMSNEEDATTLDKNFKKG